MFLLFHANFSHILHGMSIWYTLVLAVWRLIMIKHHRTALTLCTRQRCYMMIILGYGESSFLLLFIIIVLLIHYLYVFNSFKPTQWTATLYSL